MHAVTATDALVEGAACKRICELTQKRSLTHAVIAPGASETRAACDDTFILT